MEALPGKVKILLVDDDPLVLKIYQDGLSHQGLDVETSGDGLAAIKSLRTSRPDVVVLDLMMPKFSGVDVLKFIRSESRLAGLPVIVLSNSYMNEMASEALGLGVQAALLKVRCTPRSLAGIITDLAAGRTSQEAADHVLGAPKQEPARPATPPAAPLPTAAPPASAPRSALPRRAPAPMQAAADAAEFMAKAREDFLLNASATVATLRSLAQSLIMSATPNERSQRLEVFYRMVHFLSATAGLAECLQIARMASAFEALLFELMEKPAFFGPSVLLTIARTVDFFGELFERARESSTASAPPAPQGLVVDDDPISNRLIVNALQRAEVRARSTEDPLVALQWMKEEHYDLILLDIEMPGLDGFELCKRLRALPGYQKTPVIYVTSHSDFDRRAKSILSGGNDLISKPVFAIELAVKAVTHMLKAQIA